jgi:hypothetical protein
MPTPIRNDFKKAMASIVLTAGAALAEAQRVTNKAGPLIAASQTKPMVSRWTSADSSSCQ